jgi:hypothetical protein
MIPKHGVVAIGAAAPQPHAERWVHRDMKTLASHRDAKGASAIRYMLGNM